MSYTPAQVNSVFEILDVSRAASGTVDNGFGVVLSLSELDVLKTDIETRLAAHDVDTQAKVVGLVTTWDTISTQAMNLSSGSVGNVAGVNLDFGAQRDLIRQRLQVYVPVFHLVQAVARRRGPQSDNRPAGIHFGRL